MLCKEELLKSQKILNKLTPVDTNLLLGLRKTYPDLPQEYIDFMQEFGCGELGDEAYILYCDLKDPSSVFGSNFSQKESYLLIGDDFSGYCSAFQLPDWSIVEFDPTNLNPIKVANSFCEFIHQKIEWAAQ